MNVTNIFGEVDSVISQIPNFSFSTAPSWTELENIVVDWSATKMDLPEHFLLKNSGEGIINNWASEAVFYRVHIGKFAKRRELNFEVDNPDTLKFVGYFGEGSTSVRK